MDSHFLNSVFETLASSSVTIAPGLTDAEVDRIEGAYGLRFPPDYRQYIQTGMPIHNPPIPPEQIGPWIHPLRWVDWRNDSEETIRKRLNYPAYGIAFAIEHGDDWLTSWGPCPATLPETLDIVHRRLSGASPLIPIYAHRYLPSEPLEAGNPVFSIYDIDIIYYGNDLADYLCREFRIPTSLRREPGRERPRYIPFWSDIAERFMSPKSGSS
jgi:hypothetical protein